MTTTQSTSETAQIDEYLPAVLLPESRPGPLEWFVTAPFRRERAARLESK